MGGDEVMADAIDQFIEVAVVLRADRKRFGETEPVEVMGEIFMFRGVDLVDEEDHGRAALAEDGSELLIHRGQSVLGVGHEEDQRGRFDGDVRLEPDLGGESVLKAGTDAAGIDDFEGARAAGAKGGDPVPGHTGFIVDDGDATADEAVENGGLADVGTPDDGDDGAWRGRCGIGHGRDE